ncbi:MAG TPA: asparagine synthase (glutamine-hydrolyzing) [Terriglobia bacterium]|nr:asparagine synthase (glutamine-hydrolyzing) [Terriglobia bacterium]
MCGICGIHNLDLKSLESRDLIDRMSARIRHRGPDSQGKFERPHLALAIRRLSIIDLKTGDQPLSNETGEIHLVFNGEIYNYRELRQGLLERGHRFKTQSDGEVIAHLYEEKGADFVRELNGMFAIALWDERAKRLVLARDRAGEKPLYYWQHNGTLLFGSEIKSILEYPGVSRRLDPEALSQYFFYGYFPTPRSVYAEIKKLPAAHLLVVEGGTSHLECYWRMQDYLRAPEQGKMNRKQEEDACEELREKLRESAISRLVSDVPLGVFLSGGIDSSTIVATMSELSPGNVNSFSVSFPQRSFDEGEYAAYVARHFNTQHHVLTADDQSMRGALATLVDYLDEPMADPAVIPTYLLSRFAREHIKVALSGEGSDELFGGYPTYLGARAAEYYLKLPGVLRRQVFARLRELLPVSSNAVPKGLFLRRFLTHAEKSPAIRHHTWFGMFSPVELDQLFAPQWAGPHPPSSVIFNPLPRVLEGARFDEVLAEMLYLDFRMYLEDNLLVKVDRASMACSLEMRTPFLDHRLIEFAAGLPMNLKMRGFKGKYILKKAVEKWLPHKIVYRQKRGFTVPIASWIRNELRPLVAETLEEGKLKRQGLFNSAYVHQLLREHSSGRADHRKALWTLLCFQLWYDRWGTGDWKS